MHKHTFTILRRQLTRGAALALTLILLFAVPVLAQDGSGGSRGGSLLNVLLLACVAYFLVRMFRRRNGGGNTPPRSNDSGSDRSDDENVPPASRSMDRYKAARQAWEHLSSDPEPVQSTSDTLGPAPTTPTAEVDGFNEGEFIEGAKMFFSRYQQASEEGDFEPVREFMTDEAYQEAASHVRRERVDVMLLNARLMENRSESGRTIVSVFYDAQLRLGEKGLKQEQVREVWEFSRDESASNALWILEKINKMDQ